MPAPSPVIGPSTANGMTRPFSAGSLALAAWLGIASCAIVQASTPLDSEAAARFQREMRRNVGNVLPPGLMVENRRGQNVDVRDALGPQTILFKLDPDCAPCEQIMDLLREDPPRDDEATVVVLMVKDTGGTAPDLPPQVTYLRTTLDMRSEGFLAGEYTPTTFYFDQESRLVKREVGAPFPLQSLLQFPAAPAATP